ncbi:CBS and ACT domain-containing protein [Thermodesulfobacteriota bacterium]
MLVENWMSKPVITVDVNDSIRDAIKLVKQHVISMLPVMDKAKLLGIITDRDLLRASASNTIHLKFNETHNSASTIKVKKIMSRDPVTVPLGHTVEEAAQILLNHKISGMPVVNEEGHMVGTITKTDIFKAIISLTGATRRGIQFALEVEDRPGSIKVVSDIIREYGGRMASILTSYDLAPIGFRRVYIRMYGIDRFKLHNLKEALGEKARMIYMVNHLEIGRKIL